MLPHNVCKVTRALHARTSSQLASANSTITLGMTLHSTDAAWQPQSCTAQIFLSCIAQRFALKVPYDTRWIPYILFLVTCLRCAALSAQPGRASWPNRAALHIKLHTRSGLQSSSPAGITTQPTDLHESTAQQAKQQRQTRSHVRADLLLELLAVHPCRC